MDTAKLEQLGLLVTSNPPTKDEIAEHETEGEQVVVVVAVGVFSLKHCLDKNYVAVTPGMVAGEKGKALLPFCALTGTPEKVKEGVAQVASDSIDIAVEGMRVWQDTGADQT